MLREQGIEIVGTVSYQSNEQDRFIGHINLRRPKCVYHRQEMEKKNEPSIFQVSKPERNFANAVLMAGST